MLKVILLDVDGTLILSNRAHAEAWARALRAFGYRVGSERLREWIGMGGNKILKQVDPRLDAQAGTGESIVALRQSLFLDEYVQALRPTPGAHALLERFGNIGLLRVVATSAKGQELGALLATAELTDLIDMKATSDDAPNSKPDADIVKAALDKASALPHEAIYIGDTPYDIEAAHRAGVAVIALRTGDWSDAKLADAEAIYNDPADLLARFNASPIARLMSHSIDA